MEEAVTNRPIINATERAVQFIREIGVYRLSPPDGCPCAQFGVHGLVVQVSCHKSGKYVTVEAESCDYMGDSEERLRPIADEVLRQVDAYYDADGEYAATFEVRLNPEPRTAPIQRTALDNLFG
jgi:hypothetical protein